MASSVLEVGHLKRARPRPRQHPGRRGGQDGLYEHGPQGSPCQPIPPRHRTTPCHGLHRHARTDRV